MSDNGDKPKVEVLPPDGDGVPGPDDVRALAGPPGTVKSDAALIDQRVNLIFDLICRGWRTARIVRYVAASWGITERQVENYVARAREQMQALHEQTQADGLARMLARHDDLRDRAYTAGDHWLILALDKEDAKLLGMYPRQAVEVDLNGRSIDAAIEIELAKLAATGEAGAVTDAEVS